MDRAVLADLERGEVEPERGQLPAQLRDLAPGDPGQPVLDERVLDLGQLGVELGGVLVVPGPRAGVVGQRDPGPAQPLGDEAEALAVRLVGESPAELAIGLGQRLRVAREAVRQRPRDAPRRRRRGHGLHEPQRHRLVAVQDVVGLDAQRPLGHLRGHGRVPVAVAADPRAEAHERRDAWRPRPGSRPLAARRVERRIGRAIQPGHEREERGIEHGHRRAHLVERLRRDGAQVGGAPQERDLLAQAPPDLAILRRRQARVVQPLEQDRAAPQGDERRPPAGLGRMGGEHRA